MQLKSLAKVIRMPFLFVIISAGLISAQGSAQERAMAELTRLSDSYEALAQYVGPAVVQIFASGYGPGNAQTTASIIALQRSSGSGVILDANGYIVTNAHVVESAQEIEIVLATHSDYDPKLRSILKPRGERVKANILGIDEETDLAVLKIDRQKLPHLQLGDSDELRQGQLVLAFGSPLGLENTVTMGVVSSIARQLKPEDPMIYIQTDAPINPGNSGGPLVDTQGRVMGINTFIFSQSGGNEGIGFAAPSNIVRNVYQQIKEDGNVRRGIIGVHAQTITPVMANALDLPQNWGVILGDVFPGSPASNAGLQIGDVVFTLDGKLMENGRQFDVNLYSHSVGDKVRLEVLRGSERKQIEVEVIEREDDPDRFIDMVDPKKNLIPELGILAIDINRRIEEMLPRLRKRFGVLVAAISAEAAFYNGALQPGDIIYSVNNVDITGLSSLREELRNYKAGDAVVLLIQRRHKLRYFAFEME